MITGARSRSMVVFSDLHLGNPFSSVRRRSVEFIKWAARSGHDICINGDGFDVAQLSLAKFTSDVPEVLNALRNAVRSGSAVYYVVGNHDIVFEHFLSDWSGLRLAPFLNVECGASRFRVEHGHLYDPFFVASPRLYDFCTWLGGFALVLHPALYRLWIRFERLKGRVLARRAPGLCGEPRAFFESALGLEARGFDAVVFGHTHHAGEAALPHGGRYLNPGSWMLGSKYVLLAEGRAELRDFSEAPGALRVG